MEVLIFFFLGSKFVFFLSVDPRTFTEVKRAGVC